MRKETLSLWSTGQVPGALGTAPEDTPTLTLYRPRNASAGFVIVCPGGGYGHLAAHEGEPIAQRFNKAGITAGVLQYRLGPRYHHPVMLQDAQRAIRTVRAHAAEWKIEKNKVAILGFSAGGHLVTTVATHFDSGEATSTDPIERESARPDAVVPVYPVVTLELPYGHQGSRRNLLGDAPAPELVQSLCNHTQVTKDTPPCFLVHTAEDKSVPVQNSLLFATALAANGVPFSLHVYEKGQHGVGLGNDVMNKTWSDQCVLWLKARGF